jgi:hypothetical protein
MHVLPTMERIVMVLPKYHNFWVLGSLRDLHRCYGAVTDQPAIRAATSNRGAKSLLTYCYEETARDAYVLEVYKCLAGNKLGIFDELNAGPGWGWGGTCTGGRLWCLRENIDGRRRRVGRVAADAALPIWGSIAFSNMAAHHLLIWPCPILDNWWV